MAFDINEFTKLMRDPNLDKAKWNELKAGYAGWKKRQFSSLATQERKAKDWYADYTNQARNQLTQAVGEMKTAVGRNAIARGIARSTIPGAVIGSETERMNEQYKKQDDAARSELEKAVKSIRASRNRFNSNLKSIDIAAGGIDKEFQNTVFYTKKGQAVVVPESVANFDLLDKMAASGATIDQINQMATIINNKAQDYIKKHTGVDYTKGNEEYLNAYLKGTYGLNNGDFKINNTKDTLGTIRYWTGVNEFNTLAGAFEDIHNIKQAEFAPYQAIQTYANTLPPGMAASIHLPEAPGVFNLQNAFKESGVINDKGEITNENVARFWIKQQAESDKAQKEKADSAGIPEDPNDKDYYKKVKLVKVNWAAMGYYYDANDPEDVKRLNQEVPPKSLLKEYSNTPEDQERLRNGQLPKAVEEKYKKEQLKEQLSYDSITGFSGVFNGVEVDEATASQRKLLSEGLKEIFDNGNAPIALFYINNNREAYEKAGYNVDALINSINTYYINPANGIAQELMKQGVEQQSARKQAYEYVGYRNQGMSTEDAIRKIDENYQKAFENQQNTGKEDSDLHKIFIDAPAEGGVNVASNAVRIGTDITNLWGNNENRYLNNPEAQEYFANPQNMKAVEDEILAQIGDYNKNIKPRIDNGERVIDIQGTIPDDVFNNLGNYSTANDIGVKTNADIEKHNPISGEILKNDTPEERRRNVMRWAWAYNIKIKGMEQPSDSSSPFQMAQFIAERPADYNKLAIEKLNNAPDNSYTNYLAEQIKPLIEEQGYKLEDLYVRRGFFPWEKPVEVLVQDDSFTGEQKFANYLELLQEVGVIDQATALAGRTNQLTMRAQYWNQRRQSDNPFVQFAGDFVSSGVSAAPGIVATSIHPALGATYWAAYGYGEGAETARLAGASYGQQQLFGGADAIISALTNTFTVPKALKAPIATIFGKEFWQQGLKKAGIEGLKILVKTAEIPAAMELQMIALNAAQKGIFNPDMLWLGKGGVLDPQQMLEVAKNGVVMSLALQFLGMGGKAGKYILSKINKGETPDMMNAIKINKEQDALVNPRAAELAKNIDESAKVNSSEAKPTYRNTGVKLEQKIGQNDRVLSGRQAKAITDAFGSTPEGKLYVETDGLNQIVRIESLDPALGLDYYTALDGNVGRVYESLMGGKTFKDITLAANTELTKSPVQAISVTGNGTLNALDDNISSNSHGMLNEVSTNSRIMDGKAGDWDVGLNELSETQISDFINKYKKEERPDPASYLSSEYIKKHLEKFKGGVAKFYPEASNGRIGPPDGTFALPLNLARYLIKLSKGNPEELAAWLSVKPKDLGTHPVLIIIPNPKGVRIPSGREPGAFEKLWIPGGYTRGGIPEVVIDQVQPGEYTIEEITR